MNTGIDWMSVLGAVVVLAVVVWIFFVVSYMSAKGRSRDGSCKGGGCDGDCMNCSFGRGTTENKKSSKIK